MKLLPFHSRWLIILAILLFFYLALDSLVGDSPTMDEQNHLARGLAILRTGDPRLSLEHPPLANMLSALPVLLLPDVKLPLDHPSWSQPFGWYEFARLLLWEYNRDVTRMIFLSRLPIVFLTLFLALVGRHFARLLWNDPAGLVAFFLLLFDPNILAHGRYVTTDLAGTFFLLLATFLLWQLWRRRWSWPRLLLAGLGLGLAFGSKLSTLSFVPIFGLLALLPLYPVENGWRGAGRRFGQLLLAGLLSLPVLWALFCLEWQAFQFQSEQLRSLNQFSGPMPTFWAGIEQILLLSSGGRPSFLMGQFSTDGFWAYFPVAFLAKTPPAILLLLPLAIILRLHSRQTRPRALFLLIPAVLYFLMSIQSGLNIGYRHLLPMLPFVHLLVSGLTCQLPSRFTLPAGNDRLPRSYAALLLPLAILSLLVADLRIHPHYLSYFNSAAGGPANGYNVLIDSNIDWGQDLLRLQQWMIDNEVPEVKLAWFGTAVPDYYGIQYQPLPGLPYHFDLWWDLPFNPTAPEPGVYAISVSNLWELPLEEKTVFPWFRARQPDARVGYSILIYDVP